MYLYKYAILKFFLPNFKYGVKITLILLLAQFATGSTCIRVSNTLKNQKGWRKKSKLQLRNQKSREVTRETLLTQAIFEISVDRLNYGLNAL